MKYALCTTTINLPANLDGFVHDIADRNANDTVVVIAGDKKTPIEIQDFCEGLQKKYGIKIHYLSPDFQENFAPDYSRFLGWNSIQRRNMAFLFAYKAGAEIIVTIDDDNFMFESDYLESHGVLNDQIITETVETSTGWYNICRRLQSSQEFYPRGYSLRERGVSSRITSSLRPQNAVVNAGLWIGDPDIDAVTRLAINPSVANAVTTPFTLAKDIYSPFNSQNTALHRSVLPAYCMVSGVGRYDDIISSFFVKKIADHLGDAVRFGKPIVQQTRNAHDLWRDLDDERLGMQLTDRLVNWLRTISLAGDSYSSGICSLISLLRKDLVNAEDLNRPQRDFIVNILNSYEAWGEVLCR